MESGGYLKSVQEALTMSLQPSQELIDKGRNLLEKVLPESGPFPASLLKIAVDNNIEHKIRQSAAVVLTAEIKHKWLPVKNYQTEEILFSYDEETKNAVRTSFLQGMTLCNDRKVLILLGEALWQLLAIEGGNQLKGIDDEILKLMTSNPSKEKVFSMLVAYEASCRSRKYNINNKREVVNKSTEKFMPVLVQLCQNLLKESSEVNILMLLWVMKIYAKIVKMDLPPYFRNLENDKLWMNVLINGIKYCVKGVNGIVGNLDIDQVQDHSFSKCLGEIFAIFQRYLFRYGSKDFTKFKDYCENWNQNYAVQVWELQIEILKHRKELKMDNQVLCILIRNLAYSIELPKIAQSRFEEICKLSTLHIFDILKFSESDKENFEDNPVEYIRQNQEECLKLGRKMEAMNYIIHAIEDVPQEKNTFYTYLMKFIKNILDQENPNILEYEAAVLVAERIDLAIKQNDGVEAYNYFLTKASQMLSSEHDFVKFRACKLIARMTYRNLKDQQLLETISKGVTGLMEHSSLVVRSAAAQAMQMLLLIPVLKDYYKKHLKDILLVYIKIVNEYESDALIKSFEMIFQIYENEIAPFAVDLVTSLRDLFYVLMKKNLDYNSKADGEGMLESSAAAMCCLEGIQQVIRAPISAEILEKLFPIIQELLQYGFDPQNFEFFIDTVNIFNAFLMKFKGNIPDSLWAYLPIFGYYVIGVKEKSKVDIPDWIGSKAKEIFIEMHAGGDTGAESFDGFMPVFRNYISHSTASDLFNRKGFFGESFLEVILNTCKTTIERTIMSVYENQLAHCMLLSAFIVFNLGDSLSGQKAQSGMTYLEEILMMNFKILQNKNTNAMRYCLINTVGAAIYVDPITTLEFMSKNKFLVQFFELWPEAHKRTPTYTTRKGSYLGLLKILTLGEDKLKQLPVKLNVIFSLLIEDLPRMVNELECVLSGEDKFVNEDDEADMYAQFDFGMLDNKISEVFEEIEEMKDGKRPEFDQDAFLVISEIDHVSDIYDKIDDVNEVILFEKLIVELKSKGGEIATYLDNGLGEEEKNKIQAELKRMKEIVEKYKK